ncbi:MAG: helix-turn-helix transcriptional regulator [Pseudoruegeria sp.]
MDDDARQRLKRELARTGHAQSEVSEALGLAKTYVSRIVTGRIKNPSADNLLRICSYIGTDIGFIMTGEILDRQRTELLSKLADAPDGVIADVAKYVREQGLSKK